MKIREDSKRSEVGERSTLPRLLCLLKRQILTPLTLIALPVATLAEPAGLEIELRPRSIVAERATASMLQRGAAGEGAQTALERIRSLGERSDPVPKGVPSALGKLKSSDSGTPGLEGRGSVPKQGAQSPAIPNLPGQPPKPQSSFPQICQQLLGLIQQLADKANGSNGQQSQQNNATPQSGCGPFE